MDLMAFVPNFTATPSVQRSPCVQHVCEESPQEDPFTRMIPGSSVWSKLRRWFLATRVASRWHPLTRWCLRSSRMIDYEIDRHLESYPYMIHPFSSFRIFWESAMTLFNMVALLVIPVFLTFYFDEPERWYLFSHAIDAVFICDIVIWFFTGYYDYRTQLIVLDPRIIASKYLRSFFVVDVLPVLPLEFLVVIFKSMWYLTTLNLLKILRLRIMIVYARRLYYVYRINFHLYKIAEIGVIIVLCVHWTACLEYYLPLLVAKIAGQDDESWIRSPYMEKRRTRLAIYLTCVNKAIIALIGSTHYLDTKATEDIVYNLIITVLGFLGFVYLLARLSLLTTTFHSTSKRHLKLIQELEQYMRHKELPHFLQRRLLTYYNYRNRKGVERDKQIVSHVSPYLREELLMHNYLRLLTSVELFRHLPKIVVTQLTEVLHSEIFITNDVLLKAGTRGEALYFIACGTVAVYNNVGKEICHLADGAYFGEIALVMENEWRIATLVAVENCEIYILSRTDFQRVLLPYPDLLSYLQNVVIARLEQMPPLEEIAGQAEAPIVSEINISSLKTRRLD